MQTVACNSRYWFAGKTAGIKNLGNILADTVAVGVPLEKKPIFVTFGNRVERITVKELVHHLPQGTAMFAEYSKAIAISLINTPLNGCLNCTYTIIYIYMHKPVTSLP